MISADDYLIGAPRLTAALVRGALERDPSAPRARPRTAWDALVAAERRRPIQE